MGERGAAAGLGSDPEFAEAVAESGGGEGSAGLQSGELWFPRNRGGFPMPLPAWSWIP